RFFSRNSAGKYQLDVHEIRSAFALGQDAENAIRAFRDDRLGRIVARETPIAVQEGPLLAVHLLTPATGVGTHPVDVVRLGESNQLQPLYTGGGWNNRHCYEGFVACVGNDDAPALSYSLVFRSGAAEGVEPLY